MTSSKRRHRSGIAWDGVLTVLARYCDRHGAQHVLKTRPKVGPAPRVILVFVGTSILFNFAKLNEPLLSEDKGLLSEINTGGRRPSSRD